MFHLSCPSIKPILPSSHISEQYQADSGIGKIKVKSIKVREAMLHPVPVLFSYFSAFLKVTECSSLSWVISKISRINLPPPPPPPQFSAVHSPVLRPITILGPSGAHPFWGERAILACGVVKEEDVCNIWRSMNRPNEIL